MEKLSMCVMMTQCGKTFVAIEQINARLAEDPTSVHVVYTMNTLLNNYQFAKRLETIEQKYGAGSVLIFSSKYTGQYHHVTSLDEIKDRVFRVLVMCSHSKRFKDGHEWVNNMASAHPTIPIHIYYDELHYYLNRRLRTSIEEIHSLPNVLSILALTATPNKIIQKRGPWSTIRCITKDQNLSLYASLSDMNTIICNDVFPLPYTNPAFNDFDKMDEETITFLQTMIDRYPVMIQPGSRSFVPAHIRRSGHIKVRELLFERCKEAVVVILNAVDKNIQFYKEGELVTVSLIDKHGTEVSERIGHILTEYNLHGRPYFVTGFLCVGMGQTLMHESVGNFTHAVIGHMSLNNDAVYQLFGRITGRIKHWENYTTTTLYCPTPVFNRIKVMEKCAYSVVKKVIVTRDVYQEPMLVMPEGVDVLQKKK